MYKDLVIPITGTPGDMDALNIAIDLAASYNAHLTVLEMVNLPTPMLGPWGMVPDVAMSDVYSKLRSQAEINVASLKSRLGKESISFEVRMVETLVEPAGMAAHRAHYADLAVVAGSIGDTIEAETTHAYFGSLLLESGRPVLVIPPRCKVPMPPQRVVMAWRPTREATRALHDAMPLLKGAEAVDLLLVDTSDDECNPDAQPGADIATHLARHGVNMNVVVHKSGNKEVSSILLDHARQMRANLLVVGGYGHSRFREWAMGGVTRELLISASIPVLYSH